MRVFYTFLIALVLSLLASAFGPASACGPFRIVYGDMIKVKQFTVNNFTVYSILDRDSPMKAEIFSGPLSDDQKLALMPGGQAPGSVNIYLIKSPAGNILVDAGWGRSGPGRGVLAGRLKEIGLIHEDIDLVILTHMHPDHIGGLLDGPDPAFPKAKVLVARPELEYWSGLVAEKQTPPVAPSAPVSEPEPTPAPEPEPSGAPAPGPPENPESEPAADTDDWANKPLAPGASADQADEETQQLTAKPPVAPGDLPQAVIKAYGQRLTTFDFDQEISPGLTALSAVGHTPGHTIFLLKSGEHQLLFIGDLLHAAALQFPEPEEYASYDMDPVQAVATRKAVLQMAVDRDLPVAGAHIPFPGLGQVRADGKKGFTFSPVATTQARSFDDASGQWEFTMGDMF